MWSGYGDGDEECNTVVAGRVTRARRGRLGA